MSKNKQKNNEEQTQYYSYLLINKTKRAGLMILLTVIYLLMVLTIGNDILHGEKPWIYTAASLTLLGLPLILYSPIESWVYKPWQAKAQKYERHYRD